jgi:hypothetical protein
MSTARIILRTPQPHSYGTVINPHRLSSIKLSIWITNTIRTLITNNISPITVHRGSRGSRGSQGTQGTQGTQATKS